MHYIDVRQTSRLAKVYIQPTIHSLLVRFRSLVQITLTPQAYRTRDHFEAGRDPYQTDQSSAFRSTPEFKLVFTLKKQLYRSKRSRVRSNGPNAELMLVMISKLYHFFFLNCHDLTDLKSKCLRLSPFLSVGWRRSVFTVCSPL